MGGEAGFADAVLFRIDGKVGRRAKIHLFEQRVLKHRVVKVTIVKSALREVGLPKVHLFEFAAKKAGALYLHLEKGRIADLAIVEGKGNSKGRTLIKMQTQQLAILELHLAECGGQQAGHTQVAVGERTIREDDALQVDFGKIAVGEGAVFVFAFGQLVEGIVFGYEIFTRDINFGHGSGV